MGWTRRTRKRVLVMVAFSLVPGQLGRSAIKETTTNENPYKPSNGSRRDPTARNESTQSKISPSGPSDTAANALQLRRSIQCACVLVSFLLMFHGQGALNYWWRFLSNYSVAEIAAMPVNGVLLPLTLAVSLFVCSVCCVLHYLAWRPKRIRYIAALLVAHVGAFAFDTQTQNYQVSYSLIRGGQIHSYMTWWWYDDRNW